MRINERKLAAVPFVASSVMPRIEIPRNSVLRRIGIRIDGTLTVSGGTTDGTLIEDGILNLIQRIELLANGSKVLKSVTAKQIYHRARYESGVPDELVQTGVGVAVNTFSTQLWLNFLLPRTKRKNDAALLDSRPLTGLDLVLTTGGITSVIAGGDRVQVLAATVTVTFEEVPGVVGKFHQHIENLVELDLTGAGASSEREIKLTRGNVFKTLSLIVTNNSLRSDALVTNVKMIVNGVETLLDLPWAALQSRMIPHYGVTPASGKAPVVGMAIIELDRDGLLNSLLDTVNASEFKLVFAHGAPTGAAGISVLTRELEINPSAK